MRLEGSGDLLRSRGAVAGRFGRGRPLDDDLQGLRGGRASQHGRRRRRSGDSDGMCPAAGRWFGSRRAGGGRLSLSRDRLLSRSRRAVALDAWDEAEDGKDDGAGGDGAGNLLEGRSFDKAEGLLDVVEGVRA